MASKPGESGTKVSRQRGIGATSEKPLTAKQKPGGDDASATDTPSRRRVAAKPVSAAAKAGARADVKAASGKAKPTAPKAAGSNTQSAPKAAAKPRSRSTPPAAPKELAASASTRASDSPAVAKASPSPEPKPEPAATATAEAPQQAVAADGLEAAFSRVMSGSGAPTAQQLTENLERIEHLSQRLVAALSQRKTPNPAVEMPGPDLYLKATSAWMKMITENPAQVIGRQVNYWGETLKHYAAAQAALAKGVVPTGEEEAPKDKRFANPLWRTHPFFSFVRRQYEINAKAMSAATADLELPDETARRRVNWLTGQVIDMMSPTNFLATNPDALEKAVETEGESLVKGLENLVADVERSGGEMLVTLADRNAFTVGENIGTAEGTVVHRTPLFELIQYKPTTEDVHALPLVIFPPWINKFYILDLKPQNSLIRWIVEQGHTLFVVSWKNPDPSYADIGIDDYVSAYLDVIEKVLTLTEQEKLNAVGYCIAGTTLSLTLGLLAKRGDKRVNSATFFTTLTDFSDQGEFTTFLQDDFVDGIEAEVKRHGILPAQIMSRTMSFLRANDLVWGPAIRSYMMGETPPAFDLLFWNGDSTNLPARMTIEYLRSLCQKNAFAGEGFTVLGETVRLSDVTFPLCAIACETDHIAPWKDCWRGVAQMGSSDKRFILSESGHIAGIVNPPTKKKYGHYLGGKNFDNGFKAWKDSARFVEGSWWPHWGEWLEERAGDMVPARDPGKGYGPAPGTYVHEQGGLKNEA